MRVDLDLSGGLLEVAPCAPTDAAGIQAAIKLGNRSRATLGHMPFAAYFEYAAKGTLLLARVGEKVVGYALYALARHRVRLSHLCVHQAYRRRHVAKHMIDYISERHADYLGISVHCRHSYGLGEMWIKLGFTQLDERPGHGKDRAPLVVWWRDHEHQHLFTPDPETVLVRAAIDMNVLRDMAEQRKGSEESRGLLADHLVPLLQLVRTPALDSEINDMTGDRRAKFARQAQPFPRVRPEPDRQALLVRKIQTEAQERAPGYPHTEQDRRDLQYVADAVAADLNVLVTRDEKLAQTMDFVSERYGLRILRPVEVIVHIDELVRAESYRPADLLRTGYSLQLLGSGAERAALPLANTEAGERPSQFLEGLRDLALAGAERVGVFTPDGKVTAVFATRVEAGVLEIPLLRVANDGLSSSLARQLLFHLRRCARESTLDVLRIRDRHLSPTVRLAAVDDGLIATDGALYGFALDMIGPARDVEIRVLGAARRAGLPPPPPLRSRVPVATAAELERIWWPVKLIDCDLPCYLVPIRQVYSTDLLGVPASLLPRHTALGLAREHVYYKAPGGTQLRAPARLLWYMSEGGKATPEGAAVIGCSHLDEVVTGTPDELHARFQHLGVWDKATIAKAARSGRVQALRFINTEVFPKPVLRARYKHLSKKHASHEQIPPGPLPIPATLFAALYEEGRKA